MKADPFNLDRRVQVAEEATQQRQLAQMVERADLLNVLAMKSGRQVMRRLIEQMRANGMHSFAAQIQDWIDRKAPDESNLMHAERVAEIQERKLTNDRRN